MHIMFMVNYYNIFLITVYKQWIIVVNFVFFIDKYLFPISTQRPTSLDERQNFFHFVSAKRKPKADRQIKINKLAISQLSNQFLRNSLGQMSHWLIMS